MSKRNILTLPLPPATLSALIQAGYSTVEDIMTTTAEDLAKDARIPLGSSQAIFSATQTPRAPLLTQTAALLAGNTLDKISTSSEAMDVLLDGGLRRGSVLEISGPPGTHKEILATDIVKDFLKTNRGVLFVDMENMVSPSQLIDELSSSVPPYADYRNLVAHMSIYSLSELILFLHGLPLYLEGHFETGLLVLNSLSFAFQSPAGISHFSRTAALEKIKEVLARACASTGLSVVITTQLATKLVNADGSPANFDTGSRAVMVPQLGPTYLPSGRSYRVMIIPQTRTTGSVISPSCILADVYSIIGDLTCIPLQAYPSLIKSFAES